MADTVATTSTPAPSHPSSGGNQTGFKTNKNIWSRPTPAARRTKTEAQPAPEATSTTAQTSSTTPATNAAQETASTGQVVERPSEIRNAPEPATATEPQAAGQTEATPQAQAPVSEPPRMLKVKVNGQEVEVPEAEVLAVYQREHAADTKFRQAADIQKQTQAQVAKVKEFVAALQDPKKFAQLVATDAKQYGFDPQALGEALLGPILDQQIREAQLAQMTPEQRHVAELEEKVKQYEKAQAEAKAAQEAATQKAQETKRQTAISAEAKKINDTLIQALEKAGLPKSLELGAEMVNLYKEALARGQTVTPDSLAFELKHRKEQEWAAVSKEAKDLSFIPPEVRERIRKEGVDAILKDNPMAQAKGPQALGRSNPKPTKGGQKKSLQAFMRDSYFNKR